MTDARCEPQGHLHDIDGMHWVEGPDGKLRIWRWMCRDGATTPGWPMSAAGYRYLAPVATPAEVATLRAEVARLREALDRAAVVAEGASTCPIFRDEKWVTQPDAVARRCAAAIREMLAGRVEV